MQIPYEVLSGGYIIINLYDPEHDILEQLQKIKFSHRKYLVFFEKRANECRISDNAFSESYG